jgi:aspartate/tyrosine/aromatic aminotransferase
MTLYAHVKQAPADPILGLTEAFKADPRADKINLGVGVFVDENGVTPVLPSVHLAEERLLAASASKSYLPITGNPAFCAATQKLCFGDALPPHTLTAQSPGGTGGLRVAGDFLKGALPDATLWISDPTWANHKGVFAAAGLPQKSYAYFESGRNGVNREAFFASLREVPAGDIVLLHTCCHNPTGADLDPSDWATVAEIAGSGGWLPFLDFAYQGFGDGILEDAIGLRTLAAAGVPLIVAQSFSKNFGLYQDRVGALHLVCMSADEASRVNSQLKISIRQNYSNPPAHGAAIVSTILGDPELAARWELEVKAMRTRINGVRKAFVQALREAGVARDFGFLEDQRGMFSFTGISPEQVEILRDEHAVYMVGSGRINVAGITPANLPRLVAALKTVLG